ncbi:MAG TPA: iduronate sulfatase [Opitutae bacterium]|nr:iduronate sulfatase [Opitutae bacterium]
MSLKLRIIRCVVGLAGLVLSSIGVAEERPNIIVIFTDDHGWADLGAQGVLEDVQTPHLDVMAESGVRFTSGYITAPQCIPSRAGILSGQYQQRFGVDDNRFSPMPFEVLTIPERLKEVGYTTGMVGKWHLDPNVASEEWLTENTYKGKPLPPQNKRRIPLADLLPYKTSNQGFDDHFEGYIYDYWANYDLEGRSITAKRVRTEERDRLDIQSDAALAFIDRNHDKPFFLYLSYFAPHVPLESTEKYLSRFPRSTGSGQAGEMPERRRYALAMLSAVDDGVGRIREQLHAYGQLENTLIFFIGDNGAPLKFTMEDRPLSFKGGAWDGSMNVPLNGEKGMLSEGGVRVPYLISWPNKITDGIVSDIPVSSLDVGATVVQLAGLDKDAALDGENLFDLLTEPSKAQTRPIYWRFWGQAAIRLGQWKYLRAGGKEYLFDLNHDISESTNLLKVEPAVADTLRNRWADWNADLVRPFDGRDGGLNDQEVKFYAHYFGDTHTPESSAP